MLALCQETIGHFRDTVVAKLLVKSVFSLIESIGKEEDGRF